ncbi:MAG: hypothetical protein QOJ64_4183 [Acidobacteriota bacterium]|jgi:PAS domain S-box-containing protein|nr:hypothetical protein [Acidobacteriota bacterium]
MLSPKRAVLVESHALAAQPDEADRKRQPGPLPEGLRTSEIRYRRLFEAARDGILILDALTLKITDVNPFMTELLGYSRAEFLGKELWEIGLFSDKEASRTAFRALQEKGYLRYEDLPLETIDGRLREVEFVSNVYEEDNHQVIQCNIRDITDRRKVEEERRLLLESCQVAYTEADTANAIKNDFLATLSHELRTPLTSILGWSKLLADGNLDAETSERAVEIIVRNARAQGQLIDDLLDVASIVTGKLRLNVRPVELAPMIESVIDGVRPAADAKGIILRSALDTHIPAVSGDSDRLQQIMWNLLTNAIKFTSKGGDIDVLLERVASHIEITVKDTGQGIGPDFLPYVFDRFRQSDSSSTRKQGGLGLGLAIVRQLVELHGGTVEAESPGEGAGTTFKVMFPLQSVQHASSAVRQTHPLAGKGPDSQLSLENLRVLVVDDELDARELVAAVLTGRGASVLSVGSAVQALKQMERERFDVLVSDIGMPFMDGYELISKIRQLPAEQGGRIPAAALTAYASVEDRMRMLSAGYQIHIPKPVEPAELTTVVANLAERYAAPLAV